ncbi:bifunctional DNA primase/polymerase [Streptomyces kaniharaensis]|uniref:Bifunctional DNA primase/polymerase n=1 Tax=Streptomyces kaniharaensis TaxID=212423 RepID=A0A6N7L2X6_9ACTN|nr:bifunctional DNA primase/polymerase [Streptomyces kaniharaensis]
MARWCAAQGWPVHPLAPGRKTPAGSCEGCRQVKDDPRKCPCIKQGRYCHGFHAATTDPRLVDSWWQEGPDFGVGVACGPADLIVIDVDAHTDAVPDRSLLLPGIRIPSQVNLDGLASGYDTLALLAAYRGQPDPARDTSTLRVRTPSGGLHIWYRSTTAFRCSAGSSSRVALAWQVDVRAHGGYIVAPGTRTPAGIYQPVGPARLPAPLPTWLANELARTGHRIPRADEGPVPAAAVPAPAGSRRPRAAAHTLARLLQEVAGCARVPEGAGFTEKLNRAAYTAGGLVAAGHLGHGEAAAMLRDAALTARPQQARRIEDLITASLAAGALRPLHLEGRRS